MLYSDILISLNRKKSLADKQWSENCYDWFWHNQNPVKHQMEIVNGFLRNSRDYDLHLSDTETCHVLIDIGFLSKHF